MQSLRRLRCRRTGPSAIPKTLILAASVLGLLLFGQPVVAEAGSSASATRAIVRGGVYFPGKVRVGSRILRLNGAGTYEVTVFGVDVYVAGLYLEQRSNDAAAILASMQTKRLVLLFKRAVSRTRLARLLKSQRATLGNDGTRLLAGIERIRAGDTVSITQLPDLSVEVRHNRGVVGRSSEGAGLARRLLACWLGPRAASAKLKRRLLGR